MPQVLRRRDGSATSVSRDLILMLLADARLPTSGHTQSGGLEPALLGGLDSGHLGDYCRTRLETVTLVEAATAVVCRHHALGGRETASVERAWAARTPSRPLRDASRDLGRAYRRLALHVWAGSSALAELEEARAPSRPRVLGLIAAVVGLPPISLARLIAYDDVQSVLSASLKLLPADPVTLTALLVDLSPEIEAVATRVADTVAAEDIPAASAPLIEAWAQAHADTTRRLFRA
ncbi:MAG: urease accessory UreF family protein [Lapillicoccus sp.]